MPWTQSEVLQRLKMELSELRRLKTFFAEIFIVNSKDIKEIQNSLSDLIVHPFKLNDEKSSITVIGSQEDSEKIMKVLRRLQCASHTNSI